MFAVIATLICWLCSLPRTFSGLSKLGLGSAIFTFISVLLATIFAGIEAHPAGYKPGPAGLDADGNPQGDPIVTALPIAWTTFVAGINAFLNIRYTLIGQITLPSFIAEMRDPRDFPNALWTVAIAEIFLFGISGAVIYTYTGNQYNTALALIEISTIL